MRTLARLVAHHPWKVLLLWLLLLALCAPLAARTGTALKGQDLAALKNTESSRVLDTLQHDFGEQKSSSIVLVSRHQPPLTTTQGQATYRAFVDGLKDVPGVTRVLRATPSPTFPMQSADGVQALTLTEIPQGSQGRAALEEVRKYVQNYGQQHATSTLSVQLTGSEAIAQDLIHHTEADSRRAETLALPLVGLLLLVVFGALVAAGLPLLTGMLSSTLAMAALYGLTHFMNVTTFALSTVTMLCLGAGIDYALLLVNRFREELAHGLSAPDAAERTVLTAGRSVLFSGLTVGISLAGLLIPDVSLLRSIGAGGVAAILITVLTAITALPAVLSLLGQRVNTPRVLHIRWAQSGNISPGWASFARRVMAHPWRNFLLPTLLLLLLAAPAHDLRVGYSGAWGLAKGIESRDALEQVAQMGAGGLLSQYEVILDLQGHKYGPADRQKFGQTTERLKAMPGVKTVLSPFLNAADLQGVDSADALTSLTTLTHRSFSQDRTRLRLSVIPERTLRADEAVAFEQKLRQTLNASGYPYLLGGLPVAERELNELITRALPRVIFAVIGGTFLLLMLAFRSLLIPLKSVLLNALVVAAAIGIVTAVIQNGRLGALVGLTEPAGILDVTIPVLLYAYLFGLSMDYEVFLLSRVQEEHLKGKSNEEAVSNAIGHTARIITSAAGVMFLVLAAFILGQLVGNKALGLGLAAAVFLDATLVRLVMVPAFLKLAGDWNWWLPPWLDRVLPHVELEGGGRAGNTAGSSG